MKILPENFRLSKYGLEVRFVTESDAEFILKLRTDKTLSKYLHPVSPDIEAQRFWISCYKKRQEKGLDYYFIFIKNGQKLGLERIYDVSDDSFTHGSLVFDPLSPLGTSVIADIITREIAFNELNLTKNYFDVCKGNINVKNYHLKYSPSFIREDDNSYYYMLEKHNFEINKNKYLKLFIK